MADLVPEPDVTALLVEVANGNQAAQEKLVPLVYDQLKRLARRYMRRERAEPYPSDHCSGS